jgi:hypothetical protein
LRARPCLRVLLAAAALTSAASFSPRARAAEWPAEDKTLPCRPTIACTADIIPPGTFELEAGALVRQLGRRTRQWSFPFLAKLTLAPWIQLQAGSNGYTTSRGDAPSSFFDDAELVVKLHLVDQTELAPSLSVSGQANLPTGSGQPGYEPTYDALFTAYITKDFGLLHADWNVGLNEWRLFDRANALPQEFTALALSVPLAGPLGAMVEGYYFTDAAPVAPRDGGILFAVSHAARAWLMFDAGGDVGFFPSAREYSVFVGMSIVPAVLWRTSTAAPPAATSP